MSTSLADFELELNLPRHMLRREMFLLDMHGGEGNSGELYLLVGRKYYSVDLDQVGRMV